MAKPRRRGGRSTYADSEDSEEYEQDERKPRKDDRGDQRKWKRREHVDLNLCIVQEEIDASKAGLSSWASIHAGASSMLPRRICCCCGLPAEYRCTNCFKKRSNTGSGTKAAMLADTGYSPESAAHPAVNRGRYLCSAHCLALHKANDCAPKHLLNWLG